MTVLPKNVYPCPGYVLFCTYSQQIAAEILQSSSSSVHKGLVVNDCIVSTTRATQAICTQLAALCMVCDESSKLMEICLLLLPFYCTTKSFPKSNILYLPLKYITYRQE